MGELKKEKLNHFRSLIYEPEHEEGQTCWCGPKTTVHLATKQAVIDHNEQRELLSEEYEKLLDIVHTSYIPEANKEEYIKKLMSLLVKYFGADSKKCPDCGGPLWEVCEDVMKDLVVLVIAATERFYGIEKKPEPIILPTP